MIAEPPTLLSAPNFRDIGGMAAADGRMVRRGRIFRSEAVLAPTENDVEALAAAGIVLVCDLRGSSEREHAPNAWWQARGVELLEMDILADIRGSHAAWAALRSDPSPEGGRTIMTTIYGALPAAAAAHLAVICARIAAGDVPLLIHCTAGKDRTGFLCAAILRLLGVPYDAIVANYLASAGRINARVTDATRRLILDNVGEMVSEGAVAALIGVDQSYLDASFAAIDRSYGSFDAYVLDGIGLDESTREAVRATLLVQAD